MAADGTAGARLQPQFLGTGAPATAEDLNIISDHIAKMGNFMALSTSDRSAFEPDGWEGLYCFDLDLNVLYRHDGSGWVYASGDSGWDALTMANGWVAFGGAYEAPESRLLNGIVFVHGTIKSGTTSPGTTVTTLPAGRRPDAYVVVPLASSGHAAEIAPTGEVKIGANSWSATRTEFTFCFAPDQ